VLLLRSPVDPLTSLVLRGLDLDAVLLGGGGDETPDTVGLPAVSFMISARVAPLARPISSRIFAPLLSARGSVAFALAGLAAFLPVDLVSCSATFL
jgi:hypothetical protein